ncbi:hypothetical protein BC940DRAFT_301467 [Gongronella butleri]|nr:hypothetical protein BC940DRAFT_301467 [Gongronella butleri]
MIHRLIPGPVVRLPAVHLFLPHISLAGVTQQKGKKKSCRKTRKNRLPRDHPVRGLLLVRTSMALLAVFSFQHVQASPLFIHVRGVGGQWCWESGKTSFSR